MMIRPRLFQIVLFVSLFFISNAQAKLEPAVYSNEGWKWHSQAPVGTPAYLDIFGTGPNNIYIAGNYGTLLHSSDGKTWQPVETKTSATLMKIWGLAANDIWVVGSSGTVLHYNGSDWSSIDIGERNSTLVDIWGPNASERYVVASNKVLHCKSEKCQTVTFPDHIIRTKSDIHYGSVWGSGPSSVFVGTNYGVFHFNGINWTFADFKYDWMENRSVKVWGIDAENIYAVQRRKFYQYNRNQENWTPIKEFDYKIKTMGEDELSNIMSFWGIRPAKLHFLAVPIKQIFADLSPTLLITRQGNSEFLEKLNNNPALFSLWGTSEKNIYAVGIGETVFHYDGSRWQKMQGIEERSRVNYWQVANSLWGSSVNDLYIAANAGLFHYKGKRWEKVSLAPGKYYSFNEVWGLNKDFIMALGLESTSPTMKHPSEVIAYFNGTQWNYYYPKEHAKSIWGTDTKNVVVVGENGMLLKFDGSTWTVDSRAALTYKNDNGNPVQATYNTVSGSGPNDFYLAGDFVVRRRTDPGQIPLDVRRGVMVHFDGKNYQKVSSLSPDTMYSALQFTSAKDIWALSYSYIAKYSILRASQMQLSHYASDRFNNVDVGFPVNDNDDDSKMFNECKLYAPTENNLYYFCPTQNRFSHFDGHTWTIENAGLHARSFWGTPDGKHIFVINGDGAVLQK